MIIDKTLVIRLLEDTERNVTLDSIPIPVYTDYEYDKILYHVIYCFNEGLLVHDRGKGHYIQHITKNGRAYLNSRKAPRKAWLKEHGLLASIAVSTAVGTIVSVLALVFRL